MGLMDVFKVNQYKEQIAVIQAENNRLRSLVTPEAQEAMSIQQRIEALLADEVTIQGRIGEIRTAMSAAASQANDEAAAFQRRASELMAKESDIRSSIARLDGIAELEEFALYLPRYDLTNSSEYKNRLDATREAQKQMIRIGTAATGNMSWTVDGNAAKGKKLVMDMIKLCLRSFNNECESAVSDVRFNNYERCEKRIKKAAESISKLGAIMNVSVSAQYVASKIEELRLALEYQQKKQQEKEEMRALREQEREEARAQKELEEARRQTEKEQKHYQNALDKIRASIPAAGDDERELLAAKEKELMDILGEIDKAIKDIDYRQANQRAGYVYVISNIGSFGEGVYKIGMTRRLNPQERVDELGDASVPFWFDIHAMIFSDDAPKLEAALHQAFADRRVNMINTRREYFRVTLDEIEEVVHRNHERVVEFIKEPPAEQYRETLMHNPLVADLHNISS